MKVLSNCVKCNKPIEADFSNEHNDSEARAMIGGLIICPSCKILTNGRNISVLLHALELLPVKEKQTYGSTIEKLNDLLNKLLKDLK